jgi:hypothetical protein
VCLGEQCCEQSETCQEDVACSCWWQCTFVDVLEPEACTAVCGEAPDSWSEVVGCQRSACVSEC